MRFRRHQAGHLRLGGVAHAADNTRRERKNSRPTDDIHLDAAVLPAGQVASSDSQSQFSTLLAVAFIVSLFVPLSYQIGSLRFPIYKFFLFVSFMPLVIMLASGRFGRLIWADGFLLAFACWAALSLHLNHPFSFAIEPSGTLLIESFGAYLIGRCLVTRADAFKAIIRLLSFTVVAVFPFAVSETISGNSLLLDVFEPFGSVHSQVYADPRLGMHRVQGNFEHPILFGVFFSSMSSILLFYSLNKNSAISAIVLILNLFCVVFSVSAGALLLLNLQVAFVVWLLFFKKIDNKWKLLSLFVALFYVLVDLISTRTPFHVFVTYLTFSTNSSYNRILIWEFGTAEVARHPWFGIGLDEWTRPYWMSASMDNFWLVQAVRYGLPALIFLVAAIAFVLFAVSRREGLSKELRNTRRGLVFSIVATMIAISSVHLWNASYCWFMFLIGASVWLSREGEPRSKSSRPSVSVESAQGVRV